MLAFTIIVPGYDRATVFLSGGPETPRALITTTVEHARRIVHTVNALKNSSFPALLAAVEVRARQERGEWL